MAAPRKKRAVLQDMAPLENFENEDSDCDEDDTDMQQDDETGSDVDMANQMIQVEFEARNPEDHDFHGIRKLLQQLFLKANINISEFADTIISQNYIGSVIRQADVSEEEENEDDIDDIFGIISVINLTERKNLDCIKQIRAMLLEKCKQCASKDYDKLVYVLEDDSNHVGLLINERFLNIPPQIALPSFESLWKEIERSKKKKMKYNFGYYLMISKTYRLAKPSGSAGHANLKGAKPALMDTFANAEEEFFAKESVIKFEYSVSHERDVAVGGEWGEEEEDLEPTRTVMLIPSEKIPAIMTQLQDVLALPT